MKKRKERKKVEPQEIKPTVLIANTGKSPSSPLLTLVIKLILTYLITFGTVMNFVAVYNIEYSARTAVEQTLLLVTVFFSVFTLIGKKLVLPATAVICGGLLLCFSESIFSALSVLKDHLLIQLNSRLLSTLQYVPSDSVAFATQTQDYTSGIRLSMVIVTAVIAFVMSVCCYKRFIVSVTATFIVALYLPAFIAEKADYTPYLLIIITAFVGLYAIYSANAMTVRQEKLSGKKREEQRRKSVIDKAYDNITKYGRSSAVGAVAALTALAVAFGVQNAFPGYSFLNVDDIAYTSAKIFSDIGECFSQWINGGSNIFNGYFATDNFFINNRIEVNAPSANGNEQILKVYSNTPYPLYLIGDIGVNFTGNSWESIQRLTGKNKYIAGESEISDSFSNDLILPLFAIAMRKDEQLDLNFIDNDDVAYTTDEMETYSHDIYFFAQKLLDYRYARIEYLKNTDIVFKPYMPSNGGYLKQNDSFSFYGDSVLRITDRNDWMQRFETDYIVPKEGSEMALAATYWPDDEQIAQAMRSMMYSEQDIQQYIKDKKAYDKYVAQLYTDVPDSELANAARLNSEFQEAIGQRLSNYAYADLLCEYLKSHYSYSLTADNTPDSEHTILGKFLFDTKEGHCALYASAMTLALRQHGIPARYVTGFSVPSGKYDENSGVYCSVVLESNLHAWTEAYFPNLGWIAFDPTGSGLSADPGGNGDILPPFTTSTDAASSTTNVTTPPATEQTTTAPETTAASSASEQETTPSADSGGDNSDVQKPSGSGGGGGISPVLLTVILIGAGLAAAAAGVVMVLCHADDKEKRRFKRFLSAEPSNAVKEMYDFIIKLYKVTDLAPNGSELPMDYARRIDGLAEESGREPELCHIMEIIEKTEFSDNSVTEEERQSVYGYARALYKDVMAHAGKLKRFSLKITL